MHTVQTPNAPITSGHYSQGVVHNGLVFVSGQLPLDPKDFKRPPGTIAEQTEQALRNVEAILHHRHRLRWLSPGGKRSGVRCITLNSRKRTIYAGG